MWDNRWTDCSRENSCGGKNGEKAEKLQEFSVCKLRLTQSGGEGAEGSIMKFAEGTARLLGVPRASSFCGQL